MEVIGKLHEVLNLIKDFSAGCSTRNMDNGLMMIEYKGKRYAVKVSEIKNPSENPFKDIDNLEYLV